MKKLSVKLLALLCVMVFFLQGCSYSDLSALLGSGSLTEKALSAEDIYYNYAHSVVEITAKADGATFTGTGFFYDEEGTVITNYHVIETCAEAYITLLDGTTYDVTQVKAYSVEKDIAILATECPNTVPLKFRTNSVLTGEKVYAIGSSLGLTSTLSEGIVSCALRQFYNDLYIQTTAPISPGNSGGPLFDKYGNVIGINTMQMADGQNLNFAVPIGEALALSTDSPTTLKNLFTREANGLARVASLSNWSIQYISKEDSESGEEQYMLRFQLRDRSNEIVRTGGSVDIEIVNELGVTVYKKTLLFTKDNVVTVSNRLGDFEFMGVCFNFSDVTPDDAYNGMLNFTVRSLDYSFDPCAIYIDYLPVKP
ncbi:MAG: serine protease [Ruminococcaceae bacterium]|nr:serine protease [Oscillospiraceae bacterium]